MVTDLNSTNFDTFVGSCEVVLVDFYATWCGPCNTIAPVIEQFSKKYVGQVKVGKVNVDGERGLASRMNIEVLPTLIFFKNGQAAETLCGAVSLHELERQASSLLGQ